MSGFLVDFLSEPVIAAFMSSAALTISAGQLRVCMYCFSPCLTSQRFFGLKYKTDAQTFYEFLDQWFDNVNDYEFAHAPPSSCSYLQQE
jgi:hypothetical protein